MRPESLAKNPNIVPMTSCWVPEDAGRCHAGAVSTAEKGLGHPVKAPHAGQVEGGLAD